MADIIIVIQHGIGDFFWNFGIPKTFFQFDALSVNIVFPRFWEVRGIQHKSLQFRIEVDWKGEKYMLDINSIEGNYHF